MGFGHIAEYSRILLHTGHETGATPVSGLSDNLLLLGGLLVFLAIVGLTWYLAR